MEVEKKLYQLLAMEVEKELSTIGTNENPTLKDLYLILLM